MADIKVHWVTKIAVTRVSSPPTKNLPKGYHRVRFTLKAEGETFTLTAFSQEEILTLEEVSEDDLFNWEHYDGGAA